MDVDEARRKYRRNVRAYDVLVGPPTARLRARAVDRLALGPGAVALDFGCGTGLSFDLLEAAVGPAGRIVGVDVSPDMLARAREKIAARGWRNVALVEASVEEVELTPESVDAVLCFYTHDIMRSQKALARAIRALRRGGRFVAAGAKLAGGTRGLILDPITIAFSLPAITTRSGLDRPWSLLELQLGPHEVEEHLLGTAYVAVGVKGGTGPERPTDPAQR